MSFLASVVVLLLILMVSAVALNDTMGRCMDMFFGDDPVAQTGYMTELAGRCWELLR